MNLKRSKSPLASAGWLGKIAFGLVVPIMVGFFLGSYLDRKLHSSPWITLLLLMVGIASGFVWLYRVSTRDDE